MKAIISLLSFTAMGWGSTAVPAQQLIKVHINDRTPAQTIENFGASGAWFSEPIGRYWADSVKSKMAELLFSRDMDAQGNPKGIGLSAWRFNIGGGSAEQGDSSGIRDRWHRVECFLQPDGTYDWAKQQGYLWFTRQAKQYGVENLIAFSNTPPVFFNKNGLGYKTEKDNIANLKPDQYAAYGRFLTEVLSHFKKTGLDFQYISPVNEPQWDWYHPYQEGTQEGSPWTNVEIARIIRTLDSSLTAGGVDSRILLPEAAMLPYLYHPHGENGQQIPSFWGQDRPTYVGNLPHVLQRAGGHSYFSEVGDSNRIAVRKMLRDTAAAYRVPYWQTEYSLLGEGYQEGKTKPVSAMDCALFLGKVIHDDLVYGNASAWQFWNSWEPGPADHDTRYYLLALHPDADWRSGSFSITKNLWALGHYSRFVRPGMVRLTTTVQDGLTDVERAQQLMISVFKTPGQRQYVAVMLNYGNDAKEIRLQCKATLRPSHVQAYLTTQNAADNMRPEKQLVVGKNTVRIPARSIVTLLW